MPGYLKRLPPVFNGLKRKVLTRGHIFLLQSEFEWQGFKNVWHTSFQRVLKPSSTHTFFSTSLSWNPFNPLQNVHSLKFSNTFSQCSCCWLCIIDREGMDFAFAPKIKLNSIEKESRHGTQSTFTTFKIVKPLPVETFTQVVQSLAPQSSCYSSSLKELSSDCLA